MTEVSIGVTGKGYTIVASDATVAHSILKIKNEHDKLRTVGRSLVLAANGNPGDTLYFSDWLDRNIRYRELRNDLPMTPKGAAFFTRNALAENLRKSPSEVNIILGGFDRTTNTPELYWMDYLGTLAHAPYAIHGYGSFFCMSIFDRYHRPDMDVNEGVELIRRCIDELQKRFLVDLGKFTARVIDADGVRKIDI